MQLRWGAAAMLGVAASLALAAPVAAQTYPTGGWEHRQIGLGEVAWSPAAAGGIVDATTVELTKPAGDVGTSLEAADLNLPVEAGDIISVDYELVDGATTDAGAVRLFYYDHPDADTLGVAPAAFTAADGSGTLQLVVVADGTVGTLGLVYDASNASAGTVRFTDLSVAGELVLFVAPTPESTEPPATDPPTTDPPATPAPEVSESPAPGVGGERQLPVTSGVSTPALLGLGLGAVLLGGGLHAMARRRRVG